MITTSEIRQLEESCGVSKLQLMGNAGRGIYNALKERFPDLKDKRILVAAYHGNNGGDGFVAARHLCDDSETDILFIGDESRFKEEARVNYARIKKNNRIQLFSQPEDIIFDDYDIIIDALLGTGTAGNLKEPIASVVGHINGSRAFKVSVDVPTGINPDTGESSNIWVNPDLIIALHDLKHGLVRFKDKAVIVDIGIKMGDSDGASQLGR
ncbi:NAD(P)H-hydrate epimerase [Candidatus Woesearchaeota archaeon]|nr:NAD(P)H-hydrate epimerase [Candidatus Woesearchaeota archaeon]